MYIINLTVSYRFLELNDITTKIRFLKRKDTTMKAEIKLKTKKSFFSIKAKIALLTTCSIIIAVLVTFFYLVDASKSTLMDSNEVTMENLAATYNNNLSDAIMQISESANFMMGSSTISTFVSSGGTGNTSELDALATMFLNSNTSFEDISIVDKKGIVLYSSDNSLIGKNLSSETYFTNMVSTGLSSTGNVFLSDNTGDACVTIAIPLRTDMGMPGMNTVPNAAGTNQDTTNGTNDSTPVPSVTPDAAAMLIGGNLQNQPVTEFTGAIVSSVKVSQFSSILSDITVANYKSGYAFIVDSEGNLVYYPEKTLLGTSLNIDEIDNLVSDIKKGNIPDSNILTYTYNNVRQYAGFSINTDNNWIVFVVADQAEVLSSLNVIAGKTFLITILLVLVLSLIAYLFTGTITKSIKKVTQLINKTAELDFSEDRSFAKLSLQKDETGEMSRSIEKMRNVLKTMILHISEVSGSISESSDSLDNVSQSVNEHASDNSATAEELSASMQETAATTEQIHASIEMISSNSRDITEQVALGTKLSEDIIRRAVELKDSTINATQKTQKIYEEVKIKTNAAIEQAKAVEKIHTLSQTIKDIASQTNLLALNASIEAARAGKSGAGFSVVATEIGNLASQSTKTVANITEIVDEVFMAVENMSKNLEQTLNFLGKNVLSDYDTFLNSSTKYNADADVMSGTMDNIQKQIDELNTNVVGIADSISEINTMINEASSAVNDVAEKNSDIVALTSKTQNMSKENTEFANGLKEIVEKFKL